MDKSIVRKIIMTLITLLIVAYVIYLICSASFQSIRTEDATYSTMSESLDKTGYFIKDEIVIECKSSDVISYTVNDGDKVGNGEAVANLYKSSDDAAAQSKISALNEKIAVLQELDKTSDLLTVTPDTIDENVYANMFEAAANKSNGDFTALNKNMNEILYDLNERQLVTGKVSSYKEKIKELKAERDSLSETTGKSTGSINSTAAGYFISSVDGRENQITTEDIDKLTADDLKNFNKKERKSYNNPAGKVISNVFWYVACPVTKDEAIKLKSYGSNQMTLTMPFASVKDVPVTLVSINQPDANSDGVAIFMGVDMNSKIAEVRSESIIINMNYNSGISVPRNAVHEAEVTRTVEDKNGKEKTETKKVSGVYVQYGNELRFKEIVPVYADNDFVICKPDPDDDELFSGSTVKAYDKVVVEGVDLYDGKVIN